MKSKAAIATLLIATLLAGPWQAIAQPVATSTPAGSIDELAGLWKAKRYFGPFARGALIIQRTGTTYSADMVGRLLPVHIEKSELSFELPNGQGSFRGELQAKGGIRGHWYVPRGSASGFQFASPVWLKPDGANCWRGEVLPYEDTFTFFLLAQKRPDGSMGVVLRNPERDYGGWLGVDRLERDGDVVKLIGKRQGQEQTSASGTFDAENDVMRLVFPNRGGSYDFTRDDDESGFYPRGKHPGHYSYRPPLARDDGWSTATLDEVNIDRAGIERMIQVLLDAPVEAPETPKVHALLIARHGKLVLEEYFHGEHRDKLHDTRSAAKSVTAVVVGAAMQAGVPLQLSSPVYQVMYGGTVPADLEPRKRAMTLEHLLTMSSGYFCDDSNDDAPGNEERMLDQTEEPDYYRFTLKIPMVTEPGENSVYCSISPNLALGMVSRASGESPMTTFDRLVGAPLQIDRYSWILDPAGQPYGGGSVAFLPRDFMKFGQLMLNGGTWKGHRILGRDYAARAGTPLYHLRGATYGYLWWGGDYPYKGRTVYAYNAGGAGGQSVTVMPELDLIITTFGGNYSSTGTFYVQRNVIPRYLLPAVRESGDDKNAPVVPREDFALKIGDRTDGSRIVRPQ